MPRSKPIIDAAPSSEPVVLDDGQIARELELAEKGIEQAAASRVIRKDTKEPDPETRDETPTIVVCVVENNPWTLERPLKHKEKAELPRWLAELMAEKGQVVIV